MLPAKLLFIMLLRLMSHDALRRASLLMVLSRFPVLLTFASASQGVTWSVVHGFSVKTPELHGMAKLLADFVTSCPQSRDYGHGHHNLLADPKFCCNQSKAKDSSTSDSQPDANGTVSCFEGAITGSVLPS